MSRTNRCDRTAAAGRLRAALAFVVAAELFADAEDGNVRSVCVSNAVMAGVAATDVICCCRLDEYPAVRNTSVGRGIDGTSSRCLILS